jgi:hypothetical protein
MHADVLEPSRRMDMSSADPEPRAARDGGRVVQVEFEAREGRRWQAIGGGADLEQAVAFARASTPEGHYWRVIRIQDLYGD